MKIVVRDYELNDLNTVNEILNDAFKARKENFDDSCFHEFVSVNDNEVSGYLLLTKVFNPIRKRIYFLVDYVCVAEKYRGSGASDALIKYACDYASKEGASYLQLTCAPFRVSAHSLYERCGFKKIDTDLYRKELL